jgi:hypothetical protein
MTADPEIKKRLAAFNKIKLPHVSKIKFPEMNLFDWIMLFIAIFSIFLAVYFWCDGSHQISELRKELDQKTTELNKNMSYNTDEILFAFYESHDVGINSTSRDNFFMSRIGIPYDEAIQILLYTNTTDDYSLGVSSLGAQDYNASLYHFNMVLIKNPSRIDAEIGKAASFIGLNQTDTARSILSEFESNYKDRAYIDKLFGDSYFNDGDYKNATYYYLNSVDLYGIRSGTEESKIEERLWYMRYNGLYNASNIEASILPEASGRFAKVINVKSNYSVWGWIEL